VLSVGCFMKMLTATPTNAAVAEQILLMLMHSFWLNPDSKGCHADELFASAEKGHWKVDMWICGTCVLHGLVDPNNSNMNIMVAILKKSSKRGNIYLDYLWERGCSRTTF
jgi:hypothetical protein